MRRRHPIAFPYAGSLLSHPRPVPARSSAPSPPPSPLAWRGTAVRLSSVVWLSLHVCVRARVCAFALRLDNERPRLDGIASGEVLPTRIR